MIGETDERTKVHKLWFGLRKEIQHDLWRDKLNPEISSLRTIVVGAEIIEIAQSVMGGGPEQRNKRKEMQPVVQSTAMTPDGDRKCKQERGRSHKKGHQKESPKHQYQQAGPSQPKPEKHRNNKHNERKADKAIKPKMSNKEQEQHKAEGLCFVCHKSGHFSRNCPERNKVPSKSDKPPGIQSFGVGVDFGDVENQRELSKRSQGCELTINNIHLPGEGDELDANTDLNDLPEAMTEDPETESDITLSEIGGDTSTEDSQSYNPWIGDPLGHRAEERLAGICYPGDDHLSPGILDPTWFCIYPVEGDKHIVLESEHDERGDGNSVYIPDNLLRNPRFDVARWYWIQKAMLTGMRKTEAQRSAEENLLGNSRMGYAMEEAVESKLAEYCPTEIGQTNDGRFSCEQSDEDMYLVWDFSARITVYLSYEQLKSRDFNIVEWYMERLEGPDGIELDYMELPQDEATHLSVECSKATPAGSGYPALERNTAITKDATRTIPKPVVVVVHVNEQPAWALIDTGSLADFMSLNLAEQLKVKRVWLEKPLPIQLAVQGSRSKVNFGVNVHFQYQGADYQRYFDVINLQNYDIILGTPFLYQHQALVGLNSSRMIIGCKVPREMKGPQVSVLESRATEVYEENLEKTRKYLCELARPLCLEGGATALPPFRAINHSIPLIDESKIYPWRQSKCPEAMRGLWIEKKNTYLDSGRWKITTAQNTCPMLLIPKAGTPPRLRVIVDLRE